MSFRDPITSLPAAGITGKILGTQLDADAINGKTITGALFRTDTGQPGHLRRLEMDAGTGSAGDLRFYTGLATETAPGHLTMTDAIVALSAPVIDSRNTTAATITLLGSDPGSAQGLSSAQISADIMTLPGIQTGYIDAEFKTIMGSIVSTSMRPSTAQILTAETTTVATFAGLTTAGPAVTFTAPPSGVVRVDWTAWINGAGAAGGVCAPALYKADGTTLVVASTDNTGATAPNGAAATSATSHLLYTGLSSGVVYQVILKYRMGSGGTSSTFSKRNITVTPCM